MAPMAPGAAPKIQIPRWMQLVGLPLLLILAWVVAGRVVHVVFLFLVATLIALLLDPIVKAIGSVAIGRFRIRRGAAVAVVYLGFAAALIVSIWALATVVVDQTKTAANRFDTYLRSPMDGPVKRTQTATSIGCSTGSTPTA
jgi:predicted PurR-regulated permease PerM